MESEDRHMKNWINFWLFVAFISFLTLTSSFAEKTDKIKLINGDLITGEIKEMEFAKMKYSTDGMSTVYIDWDDIVFLKSKAKFRIEAEGQADFFGSFDTDTLTGQLIIIEDSTETKIRFDKIVRIYSIEDVFLERFKVNLGIGFGYTKASEIAQFNFNGKVSYRSLASYNQFKFNNVVTAEQDTNPSQNFDLSLSTDRFLGYNWYTRGFIGLQRNTKLGLDLRLLAGLGGGKDFIRTNRTLFSGGLGLQGARETSISGEKGEFSYEGIAFLGFDLVSNDDPKIDLSSDLEIFPNFSIKDRIIIEFQTSLNWEIISDFYWDLIFYDHYDNKPLSEESVTNDYGIIISFGWST